MSRLRKRRPQQVKLAGLFAELDMLDEAGRVLSCCDRVGLFVVDNQRTIQPTNHCHMRLCPQCDARRAARLARKYKARIESLHAEGYESLFLTLTIPNMVDLESGIAGLWEAWAELRGWLTGRWAVSGSLACLEVTRNRERGTWHPHLHIILITTAGFIPHAEIELEWSNLTGGGERVVWIERTDKGSLRELLKYPTKIADIETSTELQELMRVISGRHLVRAHGVLRKKGSEADSMPADSLDADLDLEPEIGAELLGCCGLDSELIDAFLAGCDLTWLRERLRRRPGEWLN